MTNRLLPPREMTEGHRILVRAYAHIASRSMTGFEIGQADERIVTDKYPLTWREMYDVATICNQCYDQMY